MEKVEVGGFLRLFNRGGYVLDFSTSSFDAFTLDSVGVALCQKYQLSKGASLTAFCGEAAEKDVDKLLFDLLEYYEFHCIDIATLSEQEYRTTFEIENHYNLSYEKYNELIGRFQNANQDGISAVFNEECFKEILKNKETAFVQLIRTDIAELNACYNAKAYKATLIIAGSILEAVLLDWLSEIDGKNYFEKEYKSRKEDTLLNYINSIKALKAPKWLAEADMAHQIRIKRNVVHAKLGIESKDVNSETCKMVIEYLEQVIQTRVDLKKAEKNQ